MSSTAHGTTPYYFVPAPSAYPVMSAIGLFLVILNTLMLYLTSFLAGPIAGPFVISDFLQGILGAVIISIVGTALHFVLGRAGIK